MDADRSIDPQLAERSQKRMSRGKLADGRREFPAKAVNEEVGLVLSQQGRTCFAEAAGTIADPDPNVADEAAYQRAAAVRGRDEYEPAHLRHGLVVAGLAEEPAILRRTDEPVDRPVADGLPDARSAVLGHHLREDAPQTVADQDHLAEGRVRAVGIEQPASPPQRLPQQVGRKRDRLAARVAEGPELVSGSAGSASRSSINRSHWCGNPREPWIKTTGTLPQLIGSTHADPIWCRHQSIIETGACGGAIGVFGETGRITGQARRGQEDHDSGSSDPLGHRAHEKFLVSRSSVPRRSP